MGLKARATNVNMGVSCLFPKSVRTCNRFIVSGIAIHICIYIYMYILYATNGQEPHAHIIYREIEFYVYIYVYIYMCVYVK